MILISPVCEGVNSLNSVEDVVVVSHTRLGGRGGALTRTKTRADIFCGKLKGTQHLFKFYSQYSIKICILIDKIKLNTL